MKQLTFRSNFSGFEALATFTPLNPTFTTLTVLSNLVTQKSLVKHRKPNLTVILLVQNLYIRPGRGWGVGVGLEVSIKGTVTTQVLL